MSSRYTRYFWFPRKDRASGSREPWPNGHESASKPAANRLQISRQQAALAVLWGRFAGALQTVFMSFSGTHPAPDRSIGKNQIRSAMLRICGCRAQKNLGALGRQAGEEGRSGSPAVGGGDCASFQSHHPIQVGIVPTPQNLDHAPRPPRWRRRHLSRLRRHYARAELV